jgi:aminopeptidase N
MRHSISLFTALLLVYGCTSSLMFAQSAIASNFTKQDSLRGSITPERSWWDLSYYHLDIKVDPQRQFISGTNTVHYKVLHNSTARMQIDLQTPMQLLKATQNGQPLEIEQQGNAHFITLVQPQRLNTEQQITLHYEGYPRAAVNAPWDGGISWKQDKTKTHFIASSCQGLGASVWWPCKDHMYDEVDSMLISVNVPKKLINVSNGRLRRVDQHETTQTFHWFVASPINNYGVNINIANYTHFSDTYNGANGTLDLNYYVLPYNATKAKTHFKQTSKMLAAFEHWFGHYPFYTDGFKLVEVPYLGMEHQSSVTYGNHYKNGYLGRDLSGTGWGLKFDFIIIHEAAHEWFANSITSKDIADLWIHESFASYAESLYLEYHFGKPAAAAYVIGTRKNIANDRPIIGPYHVNKEGSSDMYFKGANMLHTLRQWVNDDTKWRAILREMHLKFYHTTVSSKEIETFLSEATGFNLSAFFNQYLRTTKLPTLEYKITNKQLIYRWYNTVEDFKMPVDVFIDGIPTRLLPTSSWQTINVKQVTLKIDPDYYILSKRMG